MAKASKAGRPTKYKEDYCAEIVDYFLDPECDPLPLFEEFAMKIEVCKDTLYEWAKVHPKFSDAMKRCKELQEMWWIKKSLSSKLNTTFAIFMGKNCFGWSDKQNVDVSSNSIDELIKTLHDG